MPRSAVRTPTRRPSSMPLATSAPIATYWKAVALSSLVWSASGNWDHSSKVKAPSTIADSTNQKTRPPPRGGRWSRLAGPFIAAIAASRFGAAHGQALDQQGRLADADRHALAVLAAGADAGVERHVVADHGDLGQHVGAVADQGRALDRAADLAVLDQIGLGRREHELAARDVNLAAAEIDGVETLLDRADDLLALVAAAQHVGVGH